MPTRICDPPKSLAGRTLTVPLRQPQPFDLRQTLAFAPWCRTVPLAVWVIPAAPVGSMPRAFAKADVTNVVVAPVSIVACIRLQPRFPQTVTSRVIERFRLALERRRFMPIGYAPVAVVVNPWHPWPMTTDLTWQWKARFGRLRLGWIVYDDGTIVPTDWRDLMWLVRALIGEDRSGMEDDAISWTMTNRLYLSRKVVIGRGPSVHRPPHRLHHLLLAYCQPVNPYWRNRGDEDQVRRRNHYATLGPGDAILRPDSIQNAVRFLRGGVSRGPFMQWDHFAACGYGEGEHGEADYKINDCFWTNRSLTAKSVRIAPVKSPSGGFFTGLSLAGTAASFALARL